MDGQAKLALAYEQAKVWQRQNAGHRSGRCLEAARWALAKVGLRLPPGLAKPKNTAIWNFRVLDSNPGRYGWRRVTKPLPRYVIVYFVNCGNLKDGRIAGHFAIWDTVRDIHRANFSASMTDWWADRVRAPFVPIDT